MEIVQVVFFGLLIGGMITFLGIFLQQRHSSVRRRLQANPRSQCRFIAAPNGKTNLPS